MQIRKFNQLLILAGIIVFGSCNNKPRVPKDPDMAINPAFERDPPIASNIALRKLEKPDDKGNNVLFMAEFPKGLIKGQFHAVLAGDEKIVLRDDGKGGDEKADDLIFTVALKEDLPALQKEFVQADQLRKGRLHRTNYSGSLTAAQSRCGIHANST